MAVETASDRLLMLNDWGVDVKYRGRNYKGIFDSTHNPIQAGGDLSFSIQETKVHVRTSDFANAATGELVTIDSNNYVITEIQPDGTGMSDLMLEAQ